MRGDAPPDPPPSARRRCPTCNAPRGGDPVCHRCKSDLTSLTQIEQHADSLRARARQCYARGWYRQAAALAGEVVSLEASPGDLRFLACTHLLQGDFAAARRTYDRLRRREDASSPGSGPRTTEFQSLRCS